MYKGATSRADPQQGTWVKLLFILLPVALALDLFCWVHVLPEMARNKADFRQLYVAGYMVRTGSVGKLYNYDDQLRLQKTLIDPSATALPFIRPAYQAAFFAPLTLLSFRSAYFCWMGINVALIGLSFRLLRKRIRALARIWGPLPIVVLCTFFPLTVAMYQGQDSVLLLALFSGALLALEHDRESLAGCLVALGLFKFQLVLPMAFLFVVWRQWKFAKGFVPAALALAGISIALSGLDGLDSFYRSVTHIHYPVRYQMMSNVHAFLVGLFGNSSKVTIATLAVSAAVWLGVARWSAVKSGPGALVIAIPTASLVSFYLYAHDWSVLIIPLFVLMNLGMKHAADGWVALIMFCAPLICIFNWSQAYWVTVAMALILIRVLQANTSEIGKQQKRSTLKVSSLVQEKFAAESQPGS